MANENDVDDELNGMVEDAPPLDDDVEIVIDEEAPDEEDAGEEAPAEASAEEAPAEEAAAEEGGEGEEHDAEMESLPVKFRKRFEREKRLRDEIIAERDQIRTAAVQVVQRAKSIEAEAQTLRTQNLALQKQFAETLDYAYGQDITLKSSELRRARENGEHDTEMKLQGELDALRFQQNQVKQAKATIPATPQQRQPQPQAQQAPQPQQQQRPPPSPLAVKWLEGNKTWFNSPKFTGHRAFALAEDSRLVTEGYDKNSSEYYTELDRRINEAFPTLRKKPAGGKSSSPVAPVGGSGTGSHSKKTIRLTRSDLQSMQRFGLDPQNKEHLREFARNKAA